MTSSENLPSIEQPWAFRSAFADSWLSEAFARDTESLTKALQKSFSNNSHGVGDNYVSQNLLASDLIAPFIVATTTPETATASNVSGSDHETLPKRQRTAVSGGKITKRKARASKKTQTTFITADQANFRQLVQQVTGVRFGKEQVSTAPVLRPEPHRPGGRSLSGIGGGGGYLPTLDTSAFLLDHQQQAGQSIESSVGQVIGSDQFDFRASFVDEGTNTGSGFDFGTLSNFPTLESWKVM